VPPTGTVYIALNEGTIPVCMILIEFKGVRAANVERGAIPGIKEAARGVIVLCFSLLWSDTLLMLRLPCMPLTVSRIP